MTHTQGTNGDPFTPGLLTRTPFPIRRIAVLRASRIGDLICATPALRALKAAFPEAELTLITLSMLKDLALRLPFVDRYAGFPGFPGLADQFFEPRKALHFFQKMQANAFDLAIQLQGSGVYSNPFTLMLGARRTAGFIRPGDPPGRLDAALPLPQTGHEIHRVLSLVEFLGVKTADDAPEFPLWQPDFDESEKLLAGLPLPLIGLHPSSRQRIRQWPLERFTAVAAALSDRCGGTLVGLGEAADREAVGAVLSGSRGRTLNLAGRTSLPGLGAVIDRLAVLVANDSGPAHIAYARRTPAVIIFGGDTPERYGPLQPGPFRLLAYPVDCRPCEYDECPIGYICLHGVAANEVVSAACEVIRSS